MEIEGDIGYSVVDNKQISKGLLLAIILMFQQESYTESVLNSTSLLFAWERNNVRKAIGAFTCGRGKSKIQTAKMHAKG